MIQVLALHLLVEVARGPASFWAAYLRQLPRMYTCLSYFTAADKAALQARPLVIAAILMPTHTPTQARTCRMEALHEPCL